MALKEKISKLPTKPGVYLFKDEKGNILYVGKAKNLKNRVKSYLKPESIRIQMLMKHAVDVEYTVVGSELEALMLETNRIKQLRPKYNILMKDDKNYAYIRITLNEDFPRIETVRKIERDGARYFGPKTSVAQIEKMIQMLQRVFPIRTCSLDIKEVKKLPKNKAEVNVIKKTIKYPCLLYHMKKCIAPCIGACDKETYRTLINGVISFLAGKTESLLMQIKNEMAGAVTQKNFERAANLRDMLVAVEAGMKKQIITTTDNKDQDIIGLSVLGGHIYFSLFLVRSGKVIHQENFTFDRSNTPSEGEEEKEEMIKAFLTQYYEKAADLPEEILMPYTVEDQMTFESWLTQETGKKITLRIPQKGRAYDLLALAQENAAHFASQQMTQWEINEKRTKGAALDLQKILSLEKPLHRIECYDISHLGGTETVGSMVVAIDGSMKNQMYRHFRLHGVQGKIDDYAAHAEVLTRRLHYLEAEKKLPEGMTIKKATKKESAAMAELRGMQKWPKADYLDIIILQQKKISGCVRGLPHGKNVFSVRGLWIDEKKRGMKLGYFLLKKLVTTLPKNAKIYLCCKRTLADYYNTIGFTEIENPPAEVVPTECQSNTNSTMRYLPRTKKPDPSFTEIPDLIIIDGGKGQLQRAVEILQKEKSSIPVIALAKREEEIFIPGKSESIMLPKDHPALHLVQRLRDESHRFALEYQRKRRSINFGGTRLT